MYSRCYLINIYNCTYALNFIFNEKQTLQIDEVSVLLGNAIYSCLAFFFMRLVYFQFLLFQLELYNIASSNSSAYDP